ncbi:cytidylate kinase-like family protein [Methylocaldum szegediense]|uniref:Cytidylate kinase-like family protein n=1 Tax=Methylocaldum szegediense TaxID=73780 RepID=A0ABM9I1E3_9GAMM|nr:cytidylate kinase-like family protein [Methylocaldum szegediense]CAI8826637.1 Cytidylate kinase-like family protein [Methylocaldum szegediense]
MATDPDTFLKAILIKDFRDFKTEAKAQSSGDNEPTVITVSRDYGSLGDEIAHKLADYLNIPLYDREILDKVAERAKVERFKFEQYDENVSAGVSTLLFSLLTGTAGDLQTYRRYLHEVVVDLAWKGGVLVGRGAHLILSDKKVLRLRIVGSERICARREAAKSGIPLHAAERKVREINVRRNKSVLKLYGERFEHPSLECARNFDLVINTDRLSVDSAVSVVLLAMQRAGFDLRKHVSS